MMERINLSDFRAVSKFSITGGVFKKVERKLENKELEFFGINQDNLKVLTEKKMSDDNMEFLFALIPIISNVDCDIDFKQFEGLCKTPSPQFADYITLLMQHFKELYTTASKLNNLETEVTNTMKEIGVELPVPKAIKSKEEQVEELYSELENCKEDKAKRREIIKQISELENE
ncbi:hypothetical protein [Clostridium tagluense]|uniref:Uncharacterized protein n=1 Tax=Clostridium tagluense TaxID=360422 RepID=A0A401UPF5_9CLOT|nr:hypothetical protein [Clostridium tagluense]GCD11410.1 hypothetical protein Ctaglu_30330 [Clostridium tagluense]